MLQTNFTLSSIVLRQQFNQVNMKILLNHLDAVVVGASKVSQSQNRCLIDWKKKSIV